MNATQLLAHFDRLAEAPNAVPRLRRFILDLAVRGKLVAQNAVDEPAAELLKRIQEKRLRVLKKSVKSNTTITNEIDSADIRLPDGWAWAKLGDLCTKTGSGSTPAGGKDAYVGAGVPFLRSQNVYDDGLRLDGVAFISGATQERMSSTTVKPGDLLLNITGGSIGRCAIVPDSFVIGNINQHVAIIRLALLESGRFLHSVICSDYFQKHIFGNQTGAGREGLPKNRMDEILIPLAPLAEQHRIVAKVDELMALCDQLEAAQQEREHRRDRLAAASLQRMNQPAADITPEAQREHARFHLQHLPRLTTRPEHIKAMRQAILNLAVRGKLLEQDPNDEPATALLKRIQAEKARLVKLGRIKVEKGAAPIEKNDRTTPSGWALCRWNSIAMKIGDIDHKMPDTVSGGVPYVSPRDFYPNNIIDFEGAKRISREDYLRLAAKIKPDFGDLIYPRYGTIGENRLVTEQREFLASYSCAVVKTLRGFVDPKYQYIFSISGYCKDQAKAAENKTTQANVGIASIQQYIVPLPPLAEQHRIVAKVDELMALCDRLEAQITTTKTDSRRLLEAVLEAALAPA